MNRPVAQGIAAFLWLLIAGIGLFAAVDAIPGLMLHEALVAGIIGSAAALTAGWIAWRSAQWQIAETQRQFRVQIALSTLRDRFALERETARGARYLERLETSYERLRTAADQGATTTETLKLTGAISSFRTWFSGATATREFLTAKQMTQIQSFNRRLRRWAAPGVARFDASAAAEMKRDIDFIRAALHEAAHRLDEYLG